MTRCCLCTPRNHAPKLMGVLHFVYLDLKMSKCRGEEVNIYPQITGLGGLIPTQPELRGESLESLVVGRRIGRDYQSAFVS